MENAYESSDISRAVAQLIKSNYTVAFTGAGISVESGIPPFRGPNGLWSKYDPKILDLHTFLTVPETTWPAIKQIFYDFWVNAKPNPAHYALTELQELHLLHDIITQNIDVLHQKAGSQDVWEFHGTLQSLTCVKCKKQYQWDPKEFNDHVPLCRECNGLLKPDFVFFGEGIPNDAYSASEEAVSQADVVLIIGTTGEVTPASLLPIYAKQQGSFIIEINPNETKYTDTITDIFLKGKAGEILPQIVDQLRRKTHDN